jgi:transient receptor potential cation channel subfamily C protein 4
LSVCSLYVVDDSVKELSVGVGGKKNRQKERRLMKGFNITPQPSGSGTLPPVAEFIASLRDQHQPDNEGNHQNHEIFGSTLSGIFRPEIILKENPHHISTNSVPGLMSCQKQSRKIQGSLRKRRWGTLIEASKIGRVSRFIGKKNNSSFF